MQVKCLLAVLLLDVVCVMPASIPAEESAIERTVLFEEETDGFRLYRIPGIVVTAQGTALAYCEARKFTVADRGEIEIHLRRSTDGGRTWDAPRQIAHLGPRLPRNPHLPEDKRGKDMGGPDEQTVNTDAGGIAAIARCPSSNVPVSRSISANPVRSANPLCEKMFSAAVAGSSGRGLPRSRR